jgi:hypothetical protein
MGTMANHPDGRPQSKWRSLAGWHTRFAAARPATITGTRQTAEPADAESDEGEPEERHTGTR